MQIHFLLFPYRLRHHIRCNKNTLTGIIDVAMVGSMYSRGKFNERINSYGMVIMDDERVIIRTKLEKPSKIKGLALI